MAFNWQTFRVRTISSFIFIAVMLGGLMWNQWSFLVLFSIIHFGCWWEYLRLMEKIHNTVFHPYIKLGLMVAGYGLMLWFCGPGYQINGYGIKENFSLPVSAAGFALLVIGIFQKNTIRPKAFWSATLGLLYISLSWGLLMNLYGSAINIPIHDTVFVAGGLFFPVLIMVSIWMNDTMAYLVGSLIGKRPLTKISPKKTWEGTIGGVIMGVIITYLLMSFVFFPGLSFLYIIPLVSLVAAITGTFGDLLESKLKRMADVKDSGRLLPGHGGFLDRFDSLLIAVFFSWVIVRVFLQQAA
jgi:phosphatidate cytidylyltransferase